MAPVCRFGARTIMTRELLNYFFVLMVEKISLEKETVDNLLVYQILGKVIPILIFNLTSC